MIVEYQVTERLSVELNPTSQIENALDRLKYTDEFPLTEETEAGD